MDPDEDFARPGTDAAVGRAFTGIVAALAVEDPRFVRRVTRRGPGELGNVMIFAGLLATVVLGMVPLAVGLHTHALALLVLGALGCSVLPVAVPLAVRALWPSAM